MEKRKWLTKDSIDRYEAYPSGIRLIYDGGAVLDIDINLLGKMVSYWQKFTGINFNNYILKDINEV